MYGIEAMKKRTHILPKLHNNKGSLLIIAYLVVILLLTLGAVFILLSVHEARAVERERRALVAFQIAEAGIERALYHLRQEYVDSANAPASWSSGATDIDGIDISGAGGPSTSSFYSFLSASLGEGSYAVVLKNISGSDDEVWVRSTGSIGDESETVEAYLKVYNVSPWNNAIFAGAGASGAMVNGNVDIYGSVHILGTNLSSSDYAVDLGGTAELLGNNYQELAASLAAKVPALPTVVFNGETVQTLNAELRVKHGKIGLSGNSSVGAADDTGDAYKETVDGTFVTDGYGGTKGAASVYSDNGTSNAYDLGDTVQFPSLSDPYGSYATYKDYLKANALVVTDAAELSNLANITPTSNFSYSNASGSIGISPGGTLTISGIVVLDDDNSLTSDDLGFNGGTITYSGTGSILATGNVNINENLVTSGALSFPTNIMGIMTPGNVNIGAGAGAAQLDVMGLFYAEDTVAIAKQTDLLGTIVSNYFDMGGQVPSIYQVPETFNNLPAGMIGQEDAWVMKIVAWHKL
jgi:hypothetical protein